MLRSRWLRRELLAAAALFLAGCAIVLARLSAVVAADDAANVVREGGIGLLLVGLLVAAAFAWRQRGPLDALARLNRAMQSLAEGKLAVEIVVTRSDDFGDLCHRFNAASEAVAKRLERQLAELHAREEREQFLQTVLGTMVEAVVAVDAQQRILFANRAAHRLLGLGDADQRGRAIWEAARSPVLRETVQRVLAEGGEQRVEFPLSRTRSTAVLAANRLPGDPPAGAVLMMHDVTELRRLENLRRDFVSNVSHELKTPLTSIQAYTETLLEGAVDDPAHNREFLNRIGEQADRLHGLILDLLALARIESEEQAFEVEPISACEAARICLSEHATTATKRGIGLCSELPPGDARVLADHDGLRTILNNLLDNALNYTGAGGTVTLAIEPAGKTTRLIVSDTGAGIPSEHHERIFERFYRVDRARSRELGGTGLGLAIVKHLAQLFEGLVWVESEPGRGSRFVVELPAFKNVEDQS